MRISLVTRLARLSLARPTATTAPSRLLALASRPTSSRPFHPSSPAPVGASLGSGQGGKADKAATLKAKIKALQDKEKARAKALKDKERERVAKEKAKDKAKALKAKTSTKKAAFTPDGKTAARQPKSVLTPPKTPGSVWSLFLNDFRAKYIASLAPGEKAVSATNLARDAAPVYQALSAEEKADLTVRQAEIKAAYPAVYGAWLANITPAMIKEENLVRYRRRKLGLSRRSNIRPAGEPKKPISAYLAFVKEVRRTGDALEGVTDEREKTRVIAALWRGLSAGDKKEYEDVARAAAEQYKVEKGAFDAEQEQKFGPPAPKVKRGKGKGKVVEEDIEEED